jgi:hypothetical protein
MALLFIAVWTAALTSLAALRPGAAVLMMVFFAAWGGLDIDIGLRLTLFQLTLAPLCLVVLLRLTQPGWDPPRIAAGGLLLVLVLHAIIWSLLQFGFFPIVSVGDSAARAPNARAITQILVFLLTLAPAVIVPWLATSTAAVERLFRVYLASLVVLAGIGWLQLAIWYGLGFNPIPIGAFGVALGGAETYVREGRFSFESLNIYRMNSFAGEPRQLGIAMVLGMLFIQAVALARRVPPDWRLAALWVFFLASTIATFSTSAAIAWALGTAVLLPTLWLFGIPLQRQAGTLAAGALAIMLPLGLATAAAEANGIPILDLLAERTFERLESSGAVEDHDLAIIDYLKAAPASAVTGVGLGNAHLYATPYLDPLFALYSEGQVFVGKTSVVRMISELGLIGFGLFMLWYLGLAGQTRRAIGDDPELAAAVPIAVAMLMVFMLTSLLTNELYTVAGAMAALCGARRALPAAEAHHPAAAAA